MSSETLNGAANNEQLVDPNSLQGQWENFSQEMQEAENNPSELEESTEVAAGSLETGKDAHQEAIDSLMRELDISEEMLAPYEESATSLEINEITPRSRASEEVIMDLPITPGKRESGEEMFIDNMSLTDAMSLLNQVENNLAESSADKPAAETVTPDSMVEEPAEVENATDVAPEEINIEAAAIAEAPQSEAAPASSKLMDNAIKDTGVEQASGLSPEDIARNHNSDRRDTLDRMHYFYKAYDDRSVSPKTFNEAKLSLDMLEGLHDSLEGFNPTQEGSAHDYFKGLENKYATLARQTIPPRQEEYWQKAEIARQQAKLYQDWDERKPVNALATASPEELSQRKADLDDVDGRMNHYYSAYRSNGVSAEDMKEAKMALDMLEELSADLGATETSKLESAYDHLLNLENKYKHLANKTIGPRQEEYQRKAYVAGREAKHFKNWELEAKRKANQEISKQATSSPNALKVDAIV